MRAAVVDAPGTIECREVPRPSPAPHTGDLLLRTLRASICGSDVHVVHHGVGPLPFPFPPGHPGHESVAEVVESGTTELPPGTHVLAVPVIADTAAFADYQVVSAGAVVPLPPARDGTLLLAQQLGTVLYALKRFWPERPVPTAAVIGAGSAGLLFIDQLRRRGVEQIVVTDLEPSRLELARRFGADITVPAEQASIVDAVLDATMGAGAELVIEAAGYDLTRAQAVHAVAEGGRVGLFGLPEHVGDAPFPIETLLRRRASVEAESGAQSEPGLRSFRTAVDAIASGEVDVAPLLTHSLTIERVDEALELATSRADGCCKITLTFE
jgi:L-iditol 2-dehydrogenase